MPASSAPGARAGRRGRAVVLFVTSEDGTGQGSRQTRRTLDLARALVGQAHVLVATPGRPWADDSGVHVVDYGTPMALRVLMDNSDVAVVPACLFDSFTSPIRTSARLVVDLFEPVAVTSKALRVGDFYLCASEAQRDACLEALAANYRVGGSRYGGGSDRFHRSIVVVPSGTAPGFADPLRLCCAGQNEPPLTSPSLALRTLRVWRHQGARAVGRKAVAYLRQWMKRE